MPSSGLPFFTTIAAPLHDYPEWHKGRSRYGLWMIPIDCPHVLDYINRATAELSDVLHPTARQPHITLFVCGFEQPDRLHNDDFTREQLQQQIAALETAAMPSGILHIGRPQSFASAAYLSVTDPCGQLANWRSKLAQNCTEIRQQTYVPHITLGLYRQCITADQLWQRLDAIAVPPELQLPVKRLEYVTYNSTCLFGPLDCQWSVQLADC